MAALALALVSASFGAVVPAGAIDQDRGWTHSVNNQYPTGSGDPECQPGHNSGFCVSWDDWGNWQTVPYQVAVGAPGPVREWFRGQFAGSVGRFPNPMPTAHSPLFYEGSIGADTGVWMGTEVLDPSMCAYTKIDVYLLNRPPVNHGCCQQMTIPAADIILRDGQDFAIGGPCDAQKIFDHEFGHVLGLGHTVFGSQTMHSPPFTSGIQGGDAHGAQCIYDLANCEACF